MKKELMAEYDRKRRIIRSRIKDFEALRDKPYERIFEELCFCICTPQSKAVLANQAILMLKKKNRLLKGGVSCIRSCLSGVRFPNNKSRYILEARKARLDEILANRNDMEVREEIVKNIKGIGYKEASHFLRNIGRARDLAILDVHIIKNLKSLGMIRSVPKTLTKKKYLDIENRMRRFSRKIDIALRELDLLFWSKETGHVFK